MHGQRCACALGSAMPNVHVGLLMWTVRVRTRLLPHGRVPVQPCQQARVCVHGRAHTCLYNTVNRRACTCMGAPNMHARPVFFIPCFFINKTRKHFWHCFHPSPWARLQLVGVSLAASNYLPSMPSRQRSALEQGKCSVFLVLLFLFVFFLFFIVLSIN